MPRTLALLLAVLVFPALALAEPATVKRFEVTVHAAPNPDSEVVHTLIENQEVSVSETAEEGYRRVRLPDGNTGWVEEAALAFGTSEEAAAPPPSEEGTAAYPSHAPLREPEVASPAPLIYVKNLKHLAELVEDDETVSPLARDLHQRHVTSQVVGWGGMLGGLALMTAGLLLPQDDCQFIGSTEFCSFGAKHFGLMYGGLAVAALSPLIGWIIAPKREDLLDVINTWNARHPDEPFELNLY